MEEGGWAAEDIGGGEAHAVTNEAGVVDEVTSWVAVSWFSAVKNWTFGLTHWWVSMAALGWPVVPLVNWRLQTW